MPSVLDKLISESEERAADLRKKLEIEEAVLGRLREGQQAEAAQPAKKHYVMNADPGQYEMQVAPAKMTSLFEGGIPAKVIGVLRERDVGHKGMRAADITGILTSLGVTSDSAKGLLPSVISALRRRGDLFEPVSRGVYRLKK